jgi:hypothetical protein
MNEGSCPVAMELRYGTVTKEVKIGKNARRKVTVKEKRNPKIYCGFYQLCERPDKGNYPECKAVR